MDPGGHGKSYVGDFVHKTSTYQSYKRVDASALALDSLHSGVLVLIGKGHG